MSGRKRLANTSIFTTWIQKLLMNGYKFGWMQITHVSKNCIINTSDNVCDGMNHVTEKIIEETITTTDPDIIGVSSVLDAKDEENSEGMCNLIMKLHLHTQIILRYYQNHPLLMQT
jgi:hypothetical protein